MSVVWTSWHGKNAGCESVGEGGRVQNAGGVTVGCHGHGELLPLLSCTTGLDPVRFI